MTLRGLAVLSLLLNLAACSPPAPQTYPPGYEISFMNACEPVSRVPGMCGCVWEQIEANISPSDFAALERLPGPEREAHRLTRQIEGYATACLASNPASQTEPTPAP